MFRSGILIFAYKYESEYEGVIENEVTKIITPIVTTVLVVIYYVVYFFLLISLFDIVWGFLLGIIPIALTVTMIYVCIQRIKEIRSVEEDDLDKY